MHGYAHHVDPKVKIVIARSGVSLLTRSNASLSLDTQMTNTWVRSSCKIQIPVMCFNNMIHGLNALNAVKEKEKLPVGVAPGTEPGVLYLQDAGLRTLVKDGISGDPRQQVLRMHR